MFFYLLITIRGVADSNNDKLGRFYRGKPYCNNEPLIVKVILGYYGPVNLYKEGVLWRFPLGGYHFPMPPPLLGKLCEKFVIRCTSIFMLLVYLGFYGSQHLHYLRMPALGRRYQGSRAID